MVSFTVTLGQKRWDIVRKYVPPNVQPEVHRVAQALTCGSEGVGNVLVGNLNACLSQPRDQREEELVIVIVMHGLSEQAHNFTPRRRYLSEGNWTWRMWIEGKPISGRGEYILGTRRKDLYNVGIREPQVPTDHRMVLGELIGEGARVHCRYCKELAIYPIAAAKGGSMQEGDSKFSELKKMVKNPLRNTRAAESWISDATWMLDGQRAALVWTHTANQRARRTAKRRL